MSLFLKVFLWFWLAMALVIGALFVTTELTRSRQQSRIYTGMDRAMDAFALSAAETFEREGPGAVSRLFRQEAEAGDDQHVIFYLVDESGAEVTGRSVPPNVRQTIRRAAAGGRIERESERLNEMIGQLLTLSRREAGAGAETRRPLDLAALVREVVEDADFEARSRNRRVELSECEGCETAGTWALLRSAVENVVRNAVRHAPEGTAVRVSLRCQREAGAASVVVRDESAGVPDAALSEIFRPFYRVDESRTRETGGAGLGLADRAVRLHGGTVTAKNLPGGGFHVEIRLPLDSTNS